MCSAENISSLEQRCCLVCGHHENISQNISKIFHENIISSQQRCCWVCGYHTYKRSCWCFPQGMKSITKSYIVLNLFYNHKHAKNPTSFKMPYCPQPSLGAPFQMGHMDFYPDGGESLFLIIDWSTERYHIIISSTEHCWSNKIINRTKFWCIIHAKTKMIILIDRPNCNIVISLQANIFNMVIFWSTRQTEKLQSHCRPMAGRMSRRDDCLQPS